MCRIFSIIHLTKLTAFILVIYQVYNVARCQYKPYPAVPPVGGGIYNNIILMFIKLLSISIWIPQHGSQKAFISFLLRYSDKELKWVLLKSGRKCMNSDRNSVTTTAGLVSSSTCRTEVFPCYHLIIRCMITT